MAEKKVCVKVPASTANLGPGFDTIGMALDLFSWIEMKISDRTSIRLYGPHSEGIPTDKSNLIYQVAQYLFQQVGAACPELEISVYSDIPLTRGLGSSAAAIVGGLVAANALVGQPLSREALFQMAVEMEKHPDNVGASLFGGIIVGSWDGIRADYIRIEPDPRLEVLVVIPDFQLSTEKARNALPTHVSFQDAVFNVSRASQLIAALCTGDLKKLGHAMNDRLHHPYRAPFIPGMRTILEEAVHHGALGAALSGAGPTLLALVDKNCPDRDHLERFFKDTLEKERISSQIMWLKPCSEGAQIVTRFDEYLSFIDNVKGEIRA